MKFMCKNEFFQNSKTKNETHVQFMNKSNILTKNKRCDIEQMSYHHEIRDKAKKKNQMFKKNTSFCRCFKM